MNWDLISIGNDNDNTCSHAEEQEAVQDEDDGGVAHERLAASIM